MEILISQNAQNKAQICASSLGGNVSILWGFHGSCNCIYTKIPCLLFPISLCPSDSDVLLGDGLVLISAALYAVSNVGQEYTVKNLSRVEFLGMMGLFGTLISGVQM